MAKRGEPLLHPDVARRLMNQVAHPSGQTASVERLTEREVEVLGLIARGRKEIARDLTLSEKTKHACQQHPAEARSVRPHAGCAVRGEAGPRVAVRL